MDNPKRTYEVSSSGIDEEQTNELGTILAYLIKKAGGMVEIPDKQTVIAYLAEGREEGKWCISCLRNPNGKGSILAFAADKGN